MSPARAPIAMRIPISRVRSVTETSMMFMMPIPPTSREMEATAPSSADITQVDCCRDSTIWVMFQISKSSSFPLPIRCRWRIRARISAIPPSSILTSRT